MKNARRSLIFIQMESLLLYLHFHIGDKMCPVHEESFGFPKFRVIFEDNQGPNHNRQTSLADS
jgi:hypothetical protein